MKKIGNIYPKICSSENIYFAIINASKRKRKRTNVKKVLENLDNNIKIVQKMLVNKTYKPNEYKKIKIHDGARRKERIIYKPQFFPDQVIHWALMLQIQGIISKGMYEYCCASIKNRGIIYVVRKLKKILVIDRKNTKYCLKLDVKKFYPSVDVNILKNKFVKKIKCRDTLDLIDLILDSSEQGLPIGNYTSQWFANFYLQDLDHFIKEKLHIKYYIRYMDDMILFGKNKKELHKAKIEIENFLHKEHLRLKENWNLFKVDSRPIDFVGYRFYRGYTTLRKSNFLRIKRRIKKISKKSYINLTDASAVISYYGWIKHCDSYNFTQKYIKPYVNLKKCKGVISYENRKQYNSR